MKAVAEAEKRIRAIGRWARAWQGIRRPVSSTLAFRTGMVAVAFVFGYLLFDGAADNDVATRGVFGALVAGIVVGAARRDRWGWLPAMVGLFLGAAVAQAAVGTYVFVDEGLDWRVDAAWYGNAILANVPSELGLALLAGIGWIAGQVVAWLIGTGHPNDVTEQATTTGNGGQRLVQPEEPLSAGRTIIDAAKPLAYVLALAGSAGLVYLVAYLGQYDIPIYRVRIDLEVVALNAAAVAAPVGLSLAVLLAAVPARHARRISHYLMLGDLPRVVPVLMAIPIITVAAFARVPGAVFVSTTELLWLEATLVALIVLSGTKSWGSGPLWVLGWVVVVAAAHGFFYAQYRQANTETEPTVIVETTSPIGGLGESASDSGPWSYGGLFLVFRDSSEWVFADSDDSVWFVADSKITSVGPDLNSGHGWTSGGPSGLIETTTGITSLSRDPTGAGDTVSVVFTVTTAEGDASPTGEVTVSDGPDSCSNDALVGQCELTFTIDGWARLVAEYEGSETFGASTSDVFDVEFADSQEPTDLPPVATPATGASPAPASTPDPKGFGETPTPAISPTSDELTETGETRYVIMPSEAKAHVSIRLTLRANKPDQVRECGTDCTSTISFYWNSTWVAVNDEATSIKATSDAGTVSQSEAGSQDGIPSRQVAVPARPFRRDPDRRGHLRHSRLSSARRAAEHHSVERTPLRHR